MAQEGHMIRSSSSSALDLTQHQHETPWWQGFGKDGEEQAKLSGRKRQIGIEAIEATEEASEEVRGAAE